jgi:hypothetical protein
MRVVVIGARTVSVRNAWGGGEYSPGFYPFSLPSLDRPLHRHLIDYTNHKLVMHVAILINKKGRNPFLSKVWTIISKWLKLISTILPTAGTIHSETLGFSSLHIARKDLGSK